MTTAPQVVTLRDENHGSRARILVSQGFNCFEFQTRLGDRVVDALWASVGHESGEHRASSSGIPLLYPFPGRIQGTSFEWQGKTYALEEGDGRGNAIHGFVHTRPWRVLEQTETKVVGQFQASLDDPSLKDRWPADFGITATYQLEGTCLLSEFELFNPSDKELPFGFGTHPYFRVPLVAGGDAAACRLKLPVSRRWELDNMNATGRVLELPDAKTLQTGLPFPDAKFDDVFGGLLAENGRVRSSVEDGASGAAIEIDFDDTFRACVVYTPGHREAACIEPYTCVPDAWRLARQQVDAGADRLAPGERRTYRVRMAVKTL